MDRVLTDGTCSALRRWTDIVLLAAAAALGAGLVLLRLANYGPGMWWDAVNYIAVARSLLAGDGIVPLVGTFSSWPPLWPAMLAGGGLFGLDPYAFAGPLNSVIFGLTVLVAGSWLRRHLRSRFLWLWGCFSIALALPLTEMASHAMSESAFILFVTLALTQTAEHLRGGGRASLILAAAFGALACLTRYMGASLVLAAVPMLLAARVAPREKMKRIALYALIAGAPVGLWMLRNFLVDGSVSGLRGLAFYSMRFVVDEALRLAVDDWWLAGLTAPVLLALAVAAGHALATLAGQAFRRRSDRSGAPTASDVAWLPLRVFGGFALAYLTLLAAAMMSGGTFDGLQWRFLTPVYVPLLLAALLLMDGTLRRARRAGAAGNRSAPARRHEMVGKGAKALATVLMLGAVLQVAWLVVLQERGMQRWNAGAPHGYAAPRWRTSESMQRFREAALTGTVLSNAWLAASLRADGPAHHRSLPCEPHHLEFALMNALGRGEVHVLYFRDGEDRGCSQQQEEDLRSALSREPRLELVDRADGKVYGLELVADWADGELYRLRQKKESQKSRPLVMVMGSDPPVVDEPLRASFDRRRGRRLPGERWRWERTGDSDGWTSIPAKKRRSFEYTPTVHDVGRRLRASVHYEDQFGNRVKAVTEPSEPVQPVQPVPARERILRSRYDVYLRENRLTYENRSCRWVDEYGTRFPLRVYSRDSESGTHERAALDFNWPRNAWQNNGVCVVERQLPDKDIVGIQTGQVDSRGNRLWEAEHWFEESRRWLDGHLSSATSGEPAARGVFDVYLGLGAESLIFVKAPCAHADTEAMFSLHLMPADQDDLPEERRRHGFDNLDFAFDAHGDRFDGKCLATVPLPEYGISEIRTGQYMPVDGGFHKIWEAEFRR